jgi:uncharacterized membrane protein YgaE (UPF0421/DUF939 family)
VTARERGRLAAVRGHVVSSLRRLRLSALPIAQCALAAGLAWYVAHDLVGHPRPFFAPTAAVTSVGVAFGSRLRRSAELVVGVGVGIFVGELFISAVGSGPWQIAVVIGLAMIAAVLLDSGPVIVMQAAGSASLVATLLPPGHGAGTSRMVDAMVGGGVGVLVVALMPGHPVHRAREQAADILRLAGTALHDCADGLLEQQPELIKDALTRVRDTQGQIESLRTLLAGGKEISRMSPLYWNSRQRLDRLSAIADPLDNAIRNIRVLLRRSLTLVRDDEILDPRLIAEIGTLADAVQVLREVMLADPGQHPDQADAARVLRSVAKAAVPELVDGAGLSAHVVFAQLRSTLVDLLQVAGMQRVSALALLPPTVENPYITPAD